jgi:transcriptional regulator EpsA
METVQARVPHWIGGWGQLPAWSRPAARPAKPALDCQPKAFQLTADESQRFIRLISECGRIRRHYDVYCWLNGEVQYFLPHEILLSAWGDFANWSLKLDVTSALPGVRTGQLAHCSVDSLIRQAYGRWISAGRQPVLLKALDAEAALNGCHCPVHATLRSMTSLLVHGVHDKRSGNDSLFIALSCGSFTKGRSMLRFAPVLDSLFAQVDAAFRKVPAFPLAAGGSALREGGGKVLELSARELEVLEAVCGGKTNMDVAAALDISPFTVKNHVQRIFRKIGVTNRTQAAARYVEALRQQALTLAGQSGEAPAKIG